MGECHQRVERVETRGGFADRDVRDLSAFRSCSLALVAMRTYEACMGEWRRQDEHGEDGQGRSRNVEFERGGGRHDRQVKVAAPWRGGPFGRMKRWEWGQRVPA